MLLLMKISEIETITVSPMERLKLGRTSRGNQIKWVHGNKFVKLDCLGYEGIAEILVSHLLKYTDIPQTEYVEYRLCNIKEDNSSLGIGCYSKSFLNEGDTEITISDMLNSAGMSFAINYDDLRDFLYSVLHFDPKRYIDRILCLDAMTLNEDRHFGNIAFIEHNNIYRPAPIFDNGAACLSDTVMYPLSENLISNMKRVQAKPFYTDFKRQLKDVAIKIGLHYDEFFQSFQVSGEEVARAVDVLKYALRETEGIAWTRI